VDQLHTKDRPYIVNAIRLHLDSPYYFFSRCIRHILALLWNIPRYAEKLGCIRGFYTLFASDLSIGVFRVKVPGISGSLNIRPRTSDRYVFEQIFLDDDYALHADLRPRFIIDGGANVGYASIYFANRYPDADIVAIEPNAANFEILCENVREYPKIQPLRGGIWNKRGILAVDDSSGSWSCTVSEVCPNEMAENNSADCADALTLDDIRIRSGHERIDILKLDIEGAERELFSAPCRSWLALTNVMIIELHDRIKPGCSEALEHAIRSDHFVRSNRGENVVLVRPSQ
jgi:FkbM family methyltransferase